MLYLYLIYVIVSAIILALAKRNVKEWLLGMTLVSFLPLIGWLLPSIWPKKFISNEGKFLEDYMNEQTNDIEIELLTKEESVKREKELNVIPIKEALVINDFTTRRKLMLDVLKKDTMQYIDVIKMAVLNEDSETSHFAVAAVMEVKRKLSLSLQRFSVEFEKNQQDTTVARSYAQVVKEYMASGFLDDQTLKKYKYIYIQAVGILIEHGQGETEIYEEKMSVEMELHEYQEAEKTGLQYLEAYPLQEEPYLFLMEYYYRTKSKMKMQEILDELMNSTIQFSNRALTVVRYWSGGNKHELQK
ncbi:hypothetical protein [Rummeliibacillus stabekisii]|uniref:hypothetical protein n=1 Tax=Rummeliibacillus stabekisii TaxID=241244 RepID=UPI001169BAD6|nr:hypothetical protein [Rummeliibacillus stabekisii]MBB5170317.1 hypothetical protein [Rummeliibacillus stabekisii]GEL04577.1 hypothetical protein RST01_12040 [Rummeliibacillus stabekisii]